MKKNNFSSHQALFVVNKNITQTKDELNKHCGDCTINFNGKRSLLNFNVVVLETQLRSKYPTRN